jgi:O-antigen/teichoic acid export membrane protein
MTGRIRLLPQLDAHTVKIAGNAAAILATTAITSGLGFFYWLVAARVFAPSTVGLASAAISAMTLLGTLGVLGLGTLLIGELQGQQHRRASVFSAVLLVAGISGLVLGAVFALGARVVSAEFQPLASSFATTLLFSVGVACNALGFVADMGVIGVLRGHLQLTRNALFGVLKLVGLVSAPLLFAKGWTLLYATWTAGNLVSLLALAAIVLRRHHFELANLPRARLFRGLGGVALGHYALNISLQLPALLLPVIVTATLSARTNASFYIAWNAAWLAFTWPVALTTVLYASGLASRGRLRDQVRVTASLGLGGGAVAAIALWILAEPLMSLFGPAYSATATPTMRILILAIVPLTLKGHYVAFARIHNRQGRAALFMALASVLEILAAIVGAERAGLVGLSVGWVGAVFTESIFGIYVVRHAAFFGIAPPARPLERVAVVRS